MKPGDVILSVAGHDIRGGPTEMQDRFIAAVQENAPGPFPIAYERGGKTATASVQPKKEGDTWRVGVKVGPDLPEVLERFPIKEAVVEGWRRVETDFRMTLSVLGRLFRGHASMKSMSGPLDIAKFSGEAARTGAVPLVALMAAISLQLGIFNLLPIPVLDGGHLFLLGLEGIVRARLLAAGQGADPAGRLRDDPRAAGGRALQRPRQESAGGVVALLRTAPGVG